MRLPDDFHALMLCATPNCSEPDGYGITLRFCPSHADRLAQIRTELENAPPDPRAHRIYGARYLTGDGEPDDS